MGRDPGQEVGGGETPEAAIPFRFWMPNGSRKFAQLSAFCKQASQALNLTDPSPEN